MSATLRSIALNYIERKCHKPPKALLKAVNQLKKRNDIIITKPDKGCGVVVLERSQYINLLKDASISNTSKFKVVSVERPKKKGRPPKKKKKIFHHW